MNAQAVIVTVPVRLLRIGDIIGEGDEVTALTYYRDDEDQEIVCVCVYSTGQFRDGDTLRYMAYVDPEHPMRVVRLAEGVGIEPTEPGSSTP